MGLGLSHGRLMIPATAFHVVTMRHRRTGGGLQVAQHAPPAVAQGCGQLLCRALPFANRAAGEGQDLFVPDFNKSGVGEVFCLPTGRIRLDAKENV